MAFSLIAHTGTGHAGTTSGIDTTGANFIVAIAAGSNNVPAFSDNNGNTWTLLDSNATADGSVALYYCFNPIVGPGQTFTNSIGFGAISVAAFSGIATSPADQHIATNTADISVSTFQIGSVTPSQNGELVISGITIGKDSASISIDSGFSITDTAQGISGSTYGSSLAYLIQGTATAANPTWTRSAAGDLWGVNASFKVAASTTLTINVTDAESEVESVAMEIINIINISDAKSQIEVVHIAQTYAPNVLDVETELESITIKIPLLGLINITDNEAESDVLINIETINILSVTDVGSKSELVTIKIPLVGLISINDSEAEVDVISNIEIINQGINVIDSESESELVTVKVPLLGLILVSDTEVEGESITIVIQNPGTRTFNISDVESESELVTIQIPLLGNINVSDVDIQSDVIIDIETFDQGINVSDVQTESESVTIQVPLLGNVNVSDIKSEVDVVLVIGEVSYISIIDTETELESVVVQVPILGNINTLDLESEIDSASNIELLNIVLVLDIQSQQETVSIQTITPITVLSFLVADREIENELVILQMIVMKILESLTLTLSYDSRGYEVIGSSYQSTSFIITQIL